MIFGEGMYRYRVVEGWGKLPEGWDFTGTAPTNLAITPTSEMYGGEWIGVYALAVDSEDRVYVSNHGDHPVIVFDHKGQLQYLLGGRLIQDSSPCVSYGG